MRPMTLLPFLLAAGAAQAQSPERSYVAVVVGLSTYQNLPDPVELNFARSDAATVAAALSDDASYDEVFLLTDREATRDRIRETLRTRVAQLVGPEDVLVFYFVGHGIGADLGMPTFLAHDSTLADGQEDGLVLDRLARDLQTFSKAGTNLVVTDAIHRNQLDGIYFYGPAASEWPSMRDGTILLSASQASQPGGDGAFGPVFAEAIAGAADADEDGTVTVDELVTYLQDRLAGSGQTPIVAGDYDPDLVVAEGVDAAAIRARIGRTPTEPEPEEDPYPDVTIDKAKFVFSEGGSQAVQCRDQPVVQCAPSCYVWEVQAGPCEVSAVIDGVPMEGETVILDRGRYDCRRQGPELACSGPSI